VICLDCGCLVPKENMNPIAFGLGGPYNCTGKLLKPETGRKHWRP
jgi:hypothetical protein